MTPPVVPGMTLQATAACRRLAPLLRYGLIAVLLGMLAACARAPIGRDTALLRVAPADYPRFADDLAYDGLARSIRMSLAYLRRLPPERRIYFGPDGYSVAHLIRSLETFAELIGRHPTADQLGRTIAARFAVYRAAGRPESREVLYTGYYEPLLRGRRQRSDDFPVPIYARPDDLVDIDLSLFSKDLRGRRIVGRYTGRTVVPYPDREAIRKSSDFERKAPPIAWLRDEVDLFNLMVQGSGKVLLDDGATLDIQFDASNGRPYRSIGRLLIKAGKISADKISMQAIRDYLYRHPQEAETIMNHNPRYIFFKEIPAGPVGALGVPLTPQRSLAVDRTLFPLAALGYISAPMPRVDARGALAGWRVQSGFVLAQDTGSAITGAGRADLFWGSGPAAETAAGHLKHDGQLYFLVLKPVPASGR